MRRWTLLDVAAEIGASVFDIRVVAQAELDYPEYDWDEDTVDAEGRAELRAHFRGGRDPRESAGS